jgi:propanol-preferring alcohol dehydrogenase
MILISAASGVCHSDLGVMTNGWAQLPYPTPEGQVGGHEGAGKVVKLGPGAEASGVKVGDRVGVKWLSGICGTCGEFLYILLHSSTKRML